MFERLIWLVPAVVAGLGAWRPRAGLMALAASLPLFGSPPGGPYLAALDVAAIAAIVTGWRGGRPRRDPLFWPVAAFVAVSLATLVPSPYRPPSWQPAVLFELLRELPGVETWSALYTWRAAADLLLGWGLFLTVRRAFAGRSSLPLARALLGGLAALLVAGLLSQAGLLDLDGYRPQPARGRLHSLFFLSGWLSQFIVLATPPAVAGLLTAGRWGRRLALPLVALALACLLLALQRGGWAAALAQIGFVLLVLIARRREIPLPSPRRLLPGASALVVVAVVVLATATPREHLRYQVRSLQSGLSTRLPVWAGAVELTRQRPVMGWGLGAFTPAYDLVQPPGSPGVSPWRNTAHSLYLDVAAERGLLGLLALGLMGWGAALCVARPRRREEAMALALATALVGAAGYGLVQYLFHLKAIGWLLWILLGAAAATTRAEARRRTALGARLLLAAAILAIPLRAVVAEAPPYAGSGLFGLHAWENDAAGPFRWTAGSAMMRIPRRGSTLVLEMANGHPRAAQRPVRVTIAVDGETRAELEIAGGWRRHAIDLRPAASRPRDEILLALEVRPTFRPFSDFRSYPDLGASIDIRSMGIALREPRWE